MICKKCNQQIDDNASFCPYCGENVEPEVQVGSGTENPFSTFINTEDTTSEFNANDIQENKLFAMLSYLGILFLIPIFAAKNSRYARFHANQGLVLFLFEIATSLVLKILSVLNVFIVLRILLILTGFLLSLAYLVFMILGIVNAYQGKAKKLPVIGGITILR